MSLSTKLQTLISRSLASSKNLAHTVSQYYVAINIAKYYARCSLPDKLEQFVDASITRPAFSLYDQKREQIDQDSSLINSEDYTKAMATWAINEAKIKAFLRIVKKFQLKPRSSEAALIQNYLDALYNPNTEATEKAYKDVVNGLKKMLIKLRLNHRYKGQYTAHKAVIDSIIDDYITDNKTLASTKSRLATYHIADKRLDTTLSKFCILRTIESPEQVHAKIFDEAAGIFHTIFAQESDILGGLQRIVFQGDEVLYRGLDTSCGEITAEDIRKKFNFIHRSESVNNPGIAQHAFVINGELSPHLWNGRATQSTAFALNPCIAAIYALQYKYEYDECDYGWVLEFRPKKGQSAVNIMSYNASRASYTEIDVEQAAPEEIIAAHRIKVKKPTDDEESPVTMSYEISETILNPYYKHRGDEQSTPTFCIQGREVKLELRRIRQFKHKADLLQSIEVKDLGNPGFVSTYPGNAVVDRRYKRDLLKENASRETVSKDYISRRRALIKTHANLLQEWLGSATQAPCTTYEKWLNLIQENKKIPYMLGQTTVSHDSWWIWFNKNSHSCQWKCFLSVDAEDYEKAATLLIDNYFSNPECMRVIDQAKIAIKKPQGSGGRMAIILYASGTEKAAEWTKLLSNIERDFLMAGIKPRPLTPKEQAAGRSVAIDNKVPGSLYTYYKCDAYDWDRSPGYYAGVAVTSIAAIIEECRVKALTEEESTQLDAILAITLLEGKDGAEEIQTNTNGKRDLFKHAQEGIKLLNTSHAVAEQARLAAKLSIIFKGERVKDRSAYKSDVEYKNVLDYLKELDYKKKLGYKNAFDRLNNLLAQKTAPENIRVLINELLKKISLFKAERKGCVCELTTIMEKTYQRLTGKYTHEEYSTFVNNRVRAMEGNPSSTLKILASIMLSISLIALTSAVIFFPGVLATASVATTALLCGSASIGFFVWDSKSKISATMNAIDDEYELIDGDCSFG